MSESVNTIYEADPRQAKEYALDCLMVRRVPFIKSSPGIGKSSIFHQIGKEQRLFVIDLRLSTCVPEDLNGLPFFKDGIAAFFPFDTFPLENTSLPEGYDGWLLFLDEFNSASKTVQAAAYKLVLDRMVGTHKLHDRCLIAAAGNKSTDRAIVNPLSTAMQSRVIHIKMRHDFPIWLEDVAYKNDYDTRIIAFLNFKQSYLMDFRPDHQEDTFCCPRTWEFMNDLIKGKDVPDEKTGLYAGTITSGVAAEFVQFTKVFNKIPRLNNVLGDPDFYMIPNERDLKFAIISAFAEKVTEDNFDKLVKYIRRFDFEFRIMFFRSLNVRQPKLRTNPVYIQELSEISRYMHSI